MPRGLAGLRPLLISSREQYLTVAIERAERETCGIPGAIKEEGRRGVLSRVENSARGYSVKSWGKLGRSVRFRILNVRGFIIEAASSIRKYSFLESRIYFIYRFLAMF